MITLCVMPNVVGTTKDKINVFILSLLLDSIYIVPILLGV